MMIERVKVGTVERELHKTTEVNDIYDDDLCGRECAY